MLEHTSPEFDFDNENSEKIFLKTYEKFYDESLNMIIQIRENMAFSLYEIRNEKEKS